MNLRAGPGTKYKTVGNKIEKNTAVTLYELQDGWWFLKCGDRVIAQVKQLPGDRDRVITRATLEAQLLLLSLL